MFGLFKKKTEKEKLEEKYKKQYCALPVVNTGLAIKDVDTESRTVTGYFNSFNFVMIYQLEEIRMHKTLCSQVIRLAL